MKRIVHARLKINYLSPAYYSDTYTLTETLNTIENILKYTLDVTENKKQRVFSKYAPTAVIRIGSWMLAHTN